MLKKIFSVFFILINIHFVLAQTSPILSNFRVEDSEKSRVYFDSSVPITASNTVGFTISYKNISGVTVNSNQTSGHYFTVSTPFSFWDNNTLRYEGGSDFKSVTGNVDLRDFTLSYIVNNIAEPESSQVRYVTNSATGGGDGLTEATAWTIEQAMGYAVRTSPSSYDHTPGLATAGTTVWMKAGDYGPKLLSLKISGTASAPIKFIGYKNTPGDITSNYWDYSSNWQSTWDVNEMPTITGTDPFDYEGIQLRGTNYIILRNFQVANYHYGMRGNNSLNSNIVIDRMNGHSFGGGNDSGSFFIGIQTYGPGYGEVPFISNTKYKIRDCRAINADMAAISLYGEGGNLLDGNKTYNTQTAPAAVQDYHQNVNGHNNIIRNAYAENFNTQTHATSHGIGIRGASHLSNTYNLIEKSTAINVIEGLYIRNFGCEYNVIKDSYVGNNDNASSYNTKDMHSGVVIWGGSNYNIIERVTVEEVYAGITFRDVQEEPNVTDTSIGDNNIIRNCTFNKTKRSIYVTGSVPSGSLMRNNTIANCTFNNSDELMYAVWAIIDGLHFINNSITKHGKQIELAVSTATNITYTNNNFFANGNDWKEVGNGNISVDPLFVNESGGNFKLQANSGLIDSGINLDYVESDFEMNDRPEGASSDIGAYEFVSPFLGSVSPNVNICAGEQTTLVASGGVTYSWDTGETSSSITVSPTETTTYSVTITDANNITETLNVEVTVDIPPSVDAGLDVTICEGESVTLTATGVGEFLWNTGETTSSITVNPTTSTVYSVTASNSCSTDATDEVIVTVNAAVNLDAGEDVSICEGESITLTATGNSNFEWSTGETTASITVNPTTTTTYTVTSSNGNCSEADDVIVTVNQQPTVDAGADVTICEGENITLTATGVGNFLWSTGETSASITVNPNTSTVYTVTASNSCTSDATDEVLVTVNAAVNLDAGTDVSICEGESITLTATGNSNFEWSTGETTASITVSPSSTSTYTVTSTNGNCTETDDVIVEVNQQPTVDAGSDVTICEGESVTLTATGIGNFLWSTGETTASIIVYPDFTTTYSVTSSNACSTDASDEITVTVNPAVTLDAGPDVSICEGESVTLTATGNSSFEWSTGETTASITVSPSSTMAYTVSSTNGVCNKTDVVLVTVNSPPSVNAGSDISICEGESVTLVASGEGNFLWSTGENSNSIVVSPTETTTYSVVSSNSCTEQAFDEVVVTVNPAIVLDAGIDMSICEGESVTLTATGNSSFLWNTGETTASITVSPSNTTTYTVSSSNGTCNKTDQVVVYVSNSPLVDAGSDQSICEGEEVILTATGVGDFLWSTGETTSSIVVSPNSTTTYSVTASASGCQSTAVDYVDVIVGEKPNLTTDGDKTIQKGESVTLSASGTGSFLWNTGETTSSIDVSPIVTTSYTITLTSSNGCFEKSTITVVVVEPQDAGILVVYAGEEVTSCSGKEMMLVAQEGDSYLWNTGDTERSIRVNPSESTIYSVSVTKNDDTSTDYVKVNIDGSCNNESTEIALYPNPTRDIINMNLLGFQDNINLQLYSLNGTMVYTEDIDNSQASPRILHSVDLSYLAKGIYLLRLSNNGKSETKKIILK